MKSTVGSLAVGVAMMLVMGVVTVHARGGAHMGSVNMGPGPDRGVLVSEPGNVSTMSTSRTVRGIVYQKTRSGDSLGRCTRCYVYAFTKGHKIVASSSVNNYGWYSMSVPDRDLLIMAIQGNANYVCKSGDAVGFKRWRLFLDARVSHVGENRRDLWAKEKGGLTQEKYMWFMPDDDHDEWQVEGYPECEPATAPCIELRNEMGIGGRTLGADVWTADTSTSRNQTIADYTMWKVANATKEAVDPYRDNVWVTWNPNTGHRMLAFSAPTCFTDHWLNADTGQGPPAPPTDCDDDDDSCNEGPPLQGASSIAGTW